MFVIYKYTSYKCCRCLEWSRSNYAQCCVSRASHNESKTIRKAYIFLFARFLQISFSNVESFKTLGLKVKQ